MGQDVSYLAPYVHNFYFFNIYKPLSLGMNNKIYGMFDLNVLIWSFICKRLTLEVNLGHANF